MFMHFQFEAGRPYADKISDITQPINRSVSRQIYKVTAIGDFEVHSIGFRPTVFVNCYALLSGR